MRYCCHGYRAMAMRLFGSRSSGNAAEIPFRLPRKKTFRGCTRCHECSKSWSFRFSLVMRARSHGGAKSLEMITKNSLLDLGFGLFQTSPFTPFTTKLSGWGAYLPLE
jgi:hypothetical protein